MEDAFDSMLYNGRANKKELLVAALKNSLNCFLVFEFKFQGFGVFHHV